MNYYRQKYKEYRQENKNMHQRSFEFKEFPQIKEYYKNQINLGNKKPKKIIVTEIYDELIPKSQNKFQRNENDNFNYYTELNSPYFNHLRYKNLEQENIFSKNKSLYLTEQKLMNGDSKIKGFMTDYDKKIYFGGTDLREEYSSPSNIRVEIRKKVFRGSNTPQPFRNKNNIKNEEDLIENFQYYESSNIKDKYNKKYDSITRVTGYSNLVPLTNRKIEYNVNNLNNITSYNYNIFNKELKHNYSNVDVYKNTNTSKFKHNLDLHKKPQSEKKITKVEITKKYEIQKKQPQPTTKIFASQVQTQKRKYESTKIPNKSSNIQAQSSKTKLESIQKPIITSKTTVTTTTKRKYESAKPQTNIKTTNNTNSKNTTNISNIQTKNLTKKYEVKKKETEAKVQKSQEKQFKYIRKEIDMSKYNRDSNSKLVFKKGGGRYRYKENISEQDIINSRKNESQNKNIQKLSIVEKNTKKDSKKVSDSNINSTKINNLTKSSSYKKFEKSAKTEINTKVNKTNVNNAVASRNLKETKVTTTKSTNNLKNASNKVENKQIINKITNKPTTSSYKNDIITKINIQKVTTDLNINNKRKANATNLSGVTKKNYETSNKIKTQKELDINKYRRDIMNMEEQKKKISNQIYLTNIDSSSKKFIQNKNNSNIGYIENRQINEIYEMKKKKKKELTPKTKTKILGDNYKYYESKFIQNPGEIALTNSYTLHQRRNERVIYGEIYEDYEENKMKGYKTKSGMKGYKAKSKKLIKKRKMPMRDGEDNYVICNKYYQDYNFTEGRGKEELEYENDEAFNNYDQGMIYYL